MTVVHPVERRDDVRDGVVVVRRANRVPVLHFVTDVVDAGKVTP